MTNTELKKIMSFCFIRELKASEDSLKETKKIYKNRLTTFKRGKHE